MNGGFKNTKIGFVCEFEIEIEDIEIFEIKVASIYDKTPISI